MTAWNNASRPTLALRRRQIWALRRIRFAWLVGPRGQFAAALVGALALTGMASASEDFRDIPVVSALVRQVLETERSGVEVPWSNPTTGNGGIVRVEKTYYVGPNQPCRDYIRTTRRPGRDPLVIEGTGCRIRDARWLLDEPTVAGGRGGPPDEAAGAPKPRSKTPDDATAAAGAGSPAKAESRPEGRSEGKEAGSPADAKATGDAAAEIPPLPSAKPAALPPSYTMPSKSTL